MKKHKMLQVWIVDEQADKLKEISRLTDVRKTQIIRMLVSDFIKDFESKHGDVTPIKIEL